MVRDILTYPHPLLRTPTKKVQVIDREIEELVRDMFETMYQADGVGLAANQIGVSLSVMVMDTTPKKEAPPVKLVLINPEVVSQEGSISYKEGCLSFPGLTVEVERFNKLQVRALNLRGEEVHYTLEGFPAVVFQHEMDHLMGITFVDRVKGLKRRMALERYSKLQKQRV
ncbi:MAG: peptide deformylase [Aquificaceae bacterium]|nr:peptide deformylase [Aquificaceae bacterium]MCX8060042.1 peptide deformylase [Aquificaceae bacterium]MDW8096837.1 peptide deformylase [Aquificaceae bacterium]